MERPGAPAFAYAEDIHDFHLIKYLKTVNGEDYYAVLFGCRAGGGQHTATRGKARDFALTWLLSWEDYEEESPSSIWRDAFERWPERADLALKRRTVPAPPYSSGAHVNVAPKTRDLAVRGRVVREERTQVNGVIRRVFVDRQAFGVVRAQCSPDVQHYVQEVLLDAEADVDDTDALLQQQATEAMKIHLEGVCKLAEADQEREDAELLAVQKDFCVASGWGGPGGLFPEHDVIPMLQKPGHFGDEACPLREEAYRLFFKSGKTSRRGRHDALIMGIKKDLKLRFREIILARIPLLADVLKNGSSQRKAHANRVLLYLIANVDVDHIWSSAVDHPMNCFLEFKPINNFFNDARNMPGKRRHYGADVSGNSGGWLTNSVMVTSRVVRVV